MQFPSWLQFSSWFMLTYLVVILLIILALMIWSLVYRPIVKARQLQENLNTLKLFMEQLTSGKLGTSANLISEELEGIFAELAHTSPKLDRLLTIVRYTAADGSTSSRELLSGLEAVARQIDAARRKYSASFQIYSGLALSNRNNRTEVSKSETARRTEFKPDEAALLAGLTEKFYGSAAFKALGLALAGAVLLGGAGIVFIGSQSLNLRDGLNQTAEAQQKVLKETADQQRDSLVSASKSAQDSIKNAIDQITSQSNAISQRYEQFISHANTADIQLDQRITQFQAGSKDMEDKATAAAVAYLKNALDAKVKDIEDPINKSAQSTQEKISTLTEEILKRQVEIASLGLTIERLNKDASVVDTIEADLKKVRDDEIIVENAAQTINREKDLWQSVGSDSTTLHNELSKRNIDLGDIQRQVQIRQEQLKLLGQSIESMLNDPEIKRVAQQIKDDVQNMREAVATAKVDTESAKDTATRAANEAIAIVAGVKDKEKEAQREVATSSSAIDEARKIAVASASEAQRHASAAGESENEAKLSLNSFNETLKNILSGKEDDLAGKNKALTLKVDEVTQRTERLEKHSLLSLTSDECKQVQAALANRHYYLGRLDGVCLDRTASSIRTYQSARTDRPQITGILTLDELLELLAMKPAT
jgi:AraC-like DNA-binding protein